MNVTGQKRCRFCKKAEYGGLCTWFQAGEVEFTSTGMGPGTISDEDVPVRVVGTTLHRNCEKANGRQTVDSLDRCISPREFDQRPRLRG